MTTLQIRELRRLVVDDRRTIAEAAQLVGVPRYSARYQLRRIGVKLTRGPNANNLAQYGAYDRKTDALVALGTAKEVAGALGITCGTLRTFVSRNQGKYQIVRIE